MSPSKTNQNKTKPLYVRYHDSPTTFCFYFIILFFLNQNKLFSTIDNEQNKLKVPKEYLVIAGTFLFVVLVFFGIGANTLCSFIGFIFPAYQTILAIEKKNKGDDTQWLVYWILYSFFSVIETFQDFILYWIPFYFAFKLAFLLWAMLPQTRKFIFCFVFAEKL